VIYPEGAVRVIVVPVKSLSRAKSRLAPVLTPLERAALTLAMLEDVLDATVPQPSWETWVVSPDEVVLEIAARRGVRPVLETKPPLRAAVRQAEEDARAAGASAMAVLLADAPLVTAPVLSEALRTLGPVVVAPSDAGGGTNLLVRRPPSAMPARFGPSSLARHLETARARRLPVAVIDRPELGFDLDSPDDIARYLASPAQGRTREICRETDVAARLVAHTAPT
jgi:2-phospho-L-lactate guanylyltransferase